MTFDNITQQIRATKHDKKPVMIAIEGFGGAGKSTFARKLKDHLTSAYIIQTDYFIIRDKLDIVSPDMESYDLRRLENQVLLPASIGRAITLEAWDWASNQLLPPTQVPSVDYLIVEGITAYHPSIAKYYDYKIWIDTPIEVANQRGKQNDAGTETEHYWDLWSENDLSYKQKYQPEKVADFVFSNA